MNLGLFHDCSPLAPILRSSSPFPNAHCLHSSTECSRMAVGLHSGFPP
jgi:hypothetical protein